MTLPEIWGAYSEGDYRATLQLAARDLVGASGIDLLQMAGLALMNLRRRDEGIILLKAAITFRPLSPQMYINAAFIAEQNGLKHEVEYFAEAGLKAFPANADLLLLKANSFIMQMRFDEAEALYQRLLDRDPMHVQSMINLGTICRSRDDFASASSWFDRAAVTEPDCRDLILSRAAMYTQMGEDIQAIDLLEPISDDVNAQFLLSLLYLARGDYERGFLLYRSRSKAVWYKTGNLVYPLKPFDHYSDATGKRIAIIQEGGFGDMLQFVRYVPMLAKIAEAITLFVPACLFRLFEHNMPPNVTVSTSYENQALHAFDYVTTDFEMPCHFRSTLQTIPNQIPYLSVPQEMIEQRRLPDTSLKRVGLCWAGGLLEINQRSYDTRRSFDLDTYATLGAIPGIEFVSLQMGQRSEQTCDVLPLLRVLDPSFDFLDTAAVIAQLDLVITVDTAVAHLAAAIGKPVWLLSRYDACWRWLKNRPDNPWYPNVRVFGQRAYRDWSYPLAEVTESLAKLPT